VYKGDARNRFFRALVRHYGIDPQHVLHAGDSPQEIVAAQRMGLETCWVNRNGRRWPHERAPAYEVTSLEDLVTLLGALA
jgi:FMN phosphatase YigB (HAD superfamily)